MHTIDIRGERLQAGAATLRSTLSELLDRLYARDGALEPARLHALVVTDDMPHAAPGGAPAEMPPLLRQDDGDGFTLYLAAPFVDQSLAGEADQLLQLVHALHRELWRAQIATEGASTAPADALATQFAPIAALMLDEYRANRSSAWSLPGDADLLLPHLLRLLDELPAASERALADYRIDGDLETLVGLGIARLTHLMQTTAFCMGYLAGLGRTAADIAPELQAGIASSILGREWPRIAALLAGAAASEGEGRTLQTDMLRTRVIAVLGQMGLGARPGPDGTVWMDVTEASARATAEAVSRPGPLH
jgi:hypothetical protein